MGEWKECQEVKSYFTVFSSDGTAAVGIFRNGSVALCSFANDLVPGSAMFVLGPPNERLLS